jgi:hypothetical protein
VEILGGGHAHSEMRPAYEEIKRHHYENSDHRVFLCSVRGFVYVVKDSHRHEDDQ